MGFKALRERRRSNTGHPVKSAFRIKNEASFGICPVQCLGYTYTKDDFVDLKCKFNWAACSFHLINLVLFSPWLFDIVTL